ncbi:hypothetical protein GP486_004266 [Trichoglossum hirsutum]|uniref:C2H2-type domain-containing protein n=1 Tax=Trichoglossum hirsutum TaxID=265104 RepID=A0A9P8RPZ5_9PEZI|nr:hypothetical protein GP486_004266 [Trichoglossum hirsutum]
MELETLSLEEDIPEYRRQRTKDWSGTVGPSDPGEEHPKGIISQMYYGISYFCQGLLHNIVDAKAQQTEPMSMSLYRLLNSAYTSFITWGDDFGVGSENLDDALKNLRDAYKRLEHIQIEGSEMQQLTEADLLPPMLQILMAHQLEWEQELQRRATEVDLVREKASMHVQLYPDLHDRPKDDGDSSTASSNNSSLEDALESLRDDIEALIELGPCLREPIPDLLIPDVPAPPPQGTTDKCQTFFDGIKQKFPYCDDSLARALSRALYDTMMRLQSKRQTASGEAVKQPELASKPPADSGYGTGLKDPSQDPESFHEGSITMGSSYAHTLASYADVDNGTTRTPFPSQPKNLKIGESFHCVACGQQVAKTESGAAWRDEWLKHLQAQHEVHPNWDDTKCPFCLRSIATGGRDIVRHVERHLRQLSLAALTANPADENSDNESDDSDISSPPSDGDAMPLDHPGSPQAGQIEALENHFLYRTALQEEDGLWHCPWEGEGYCHHKPSVLRADFEYDPIAPFLLPPTHGPVLDAGPLTVYVASSLSPTSNPYNARQKDANGPAMSSRQERFYISTSRRSMACTRAAAGSCAPAQAVGGRDLATALQANGCSLSISKMSTRTFQVCCAHRMTVETGPQGVQGASVSESPRHQGIDINHQKLSYHNLDFHVAGVQKLRQTSNKVGAFIGLWIKNLKAKEEKEGSESVSEINKAY